MYVIVTQCCPMRFSMTSDLFILPSKFSFTSFIDHMTFSTKVKKKWLEN